MKFPSYPLSHPTPETHSSAMGKLRKPGPATKTRIFEATTRNTRRGPKLVNVPVQIPQTTGFKIEDGLTIKEASMVPGRISGRQ